MKRSHTIRKIKGLTIRELAGEASFRARARISRAISRASDNPQTTYVSDADLRRSLGGKSIAEVASRIRDGREAHLLPGLVDLTSTVAAVKQLFPASIDHARLEGDQILDHRITLFGRQVDLGPKIDWRRDPQADIGWPFDHFTRMPLVIGQGADVRVVWELNRLHHLVTLGRAYLLTGDERYTEEFLLQLASWNEDNPPRFGVNWIVAMEAGIRAVNIIAALEMFRGSPKVDDQAIELILKMLLAHGRFIRANLEFSYRTTSNHYLSDLIGLFAIGVIAPEIREARGWREYGARRLVKEMNQQVHADGVDYEGSTGYHRLVLEIFSLFFSLRQASDLDPGTAFRTRLEAMFEFVRSYLKPDQTAPSLGDSDDGRLIRFKDRPAYDHSYLMSIGSMLLQNPVFKQSSEIDEEALWWFGRAGLDGFERLPINKQDAGSHGFMQAQIFVQRAGGLYSIVDCGDHGARGRGSHAHSDALSIEVFALDRTFIRDPGTYAYTGSEKQRNLFRSTTFHNTVRIDGEEISQVNEGELFAFESNVRPVVNLWESSAERDVLDAEHHAYQRLASPVVHRRVVTFEKREGYWIIQDIFDGDGHHRFEFYFNCDAGLEVSIDAANRATACDEKAALTIVPGGDYELEARIEPRWISPAYGTRLNSSAIIYSLAAQAPLEVSFQLLAAKRG